MINEGKFIQIIYLLLLKVIQVIRPPKSLKVSKPTMKSITE